MQANKHTISTDPEQSSRRRAILRLLFKASRDKVVELLQSSNRAKKVACTKEHNRHRQQDAHLRPQLYISKGKRATCTRIAQKSTGRQKGRDHMIMAPLTLTRDHLAGSDNVGLGFDGIIKMARIGWTLFRGGFPSTISMHVIARDQMSAWPLYGTCAKGSTGGKHWINVSRCKARHCACSPAITIEGADVSQ